MSEGTTPQEILKVWLEEDEPQFSVLPVFTDAAIWGLLFADIARLIGQAYEESGEGAAADTVTRIRDMFVAEIDTPAE